MANNLDWLEEWFGRNAAQTRRNQIIPKGIYNRLEYIPSGIYSFDWRTFFFGQFMRDEIHSMGHVRLRTALKRERKKAGLNQNFIAKKTNRSQAYISKFETGDLRLDVIDFLLFCEVIGCDPHRILKEVYFNK